MKNGVKCNIRFEELENYRDKEGYINLDELNLELTEESREKVGNEDRIKNWIDFSGVEALIKGECKIDNKRNGGIYSELIVEELAKQAGLEAAYYDLIKIKGEYGVLSKNILTYDNDDLITIQSLIGNTKFNEEYPEITDYIEVEEKLHQSLKFEGLESNNIREIIKDFRKQSAFFIMICSIDMHPENISLITCINPETKQKKQKLAPIYDAESSLMLDIDLDILKRIQKNGLGLQRNVNMQDPKIAVLEGEYTSLWKNTLDTLLEDDEVYDFVMDCYDNLNIHEAIQNVENKIKAPLPEVVKTTATYVYEFRKKEISKIIYPELGENSIGEVYSNEISKRSIDEGIRQGEEDEILRKIMHIYGIEEREARKVSKLVLKHIINKEYLEKNVKIC